MEDSDILELFFARSEDALVQLSQRYGGLCMVVAQRILSSREDAQECVNDAFLPPGMPSRPSGRRPCGPFCAGSPGTWP